MKQKIVKYIYFIILFSLIFQSPLHCQFKKQYSISEMEMIVIKYDSLDIIISINNQDSCKNFYFYRDPTFDTAYYKENKPFIDISDTSKTPTDFINFKDSLYIISIPDWNSRNQLLFFCRRIDGSVAPIFDTDSFLFILYNSQKWIVYNSDCEYLLSFIKGFSEFEFGNQVISDIEIDIIDMKKVGVDKNRNKRLSTLYSSSYDFLDDEGIDLETYIEGIEKILTCISIPIHCRYR